MLVVHLEYVRSSDSDLGRGFSVVRTGRAERGVGC